MNETNPASDRHNVRASDLIPKPTPADTAANLVRGGLIGVAETIPGVSGGTIALITGIYSRLIASGKHLTDIPKELVTRGDVKAATRRIDWWLLAPVGIGAVVVVFLVAGPMSSFYEGQPVYAKALFMGMILASVAIPFLEITPGSLAARADKLKAAALFFVAAGLAFGLTSLPGSERPDPPLLLVFGAAAIAVCALVLPGVSGSFFLLVMGLYTTTLDAVSELNFSYLGVFLLGAIVGFVSFVRILEWLLENHHTWAMVAAAGLLLGSLRALWPWQVEEGDPGPDREGTLLGIGSDWPMALVFFLAGAIVVSLVAFAQRKFYAADARASEAARQAD